jgi:hypothetical protein
MALQAQLLQAVMWHHRIIKQRGEERGNIYFERINWIVKEWVPLDAQQRVVESTGDEDSHHRKKWVDVSQPPALQINSAVIMRYGKR